MALPAKAKPIPAGKEIIAVSLIEDYTFRLTPCLFLSDQQEAITGNALTPKTEVIAGTKL